jgi:hypothetical protein
VWSGDARRVQFIQFEFLLDDLKVDYSRMTDSPFIESFTTAQCAYLR